jgi:hypothetical protein
MEQGSWRQQGKRTGRERVKVQEKATVMLWVTMKVAHTEKVRGRGYSKAKQLGSSRG